MRVKAAVSLGLKLLGKMPCLSASLGLLGGKNGSAGRGLVPRDMMLHRRLFFGTLHQQRLPRGANATQLGTDDTLLTRLRQVCYDTIEVAPIFS